MFNLTIFTQFGDGSKSSVYNMWASEADAQGMLGMKIISSFINSYFIFIVFWK